MNEAVVTNELFDLIHYVQPWNYNLPLIWRWIHGASLAFTKPVRHNTAPCPSDHYGTSNYKKKSRWDVDVIAVWVLLHVYKITTVQRLVIADMMLREQGISEHVGGGPANLISGNKKKRWITQSSWYVLGFRLEAALTEPPADLKLSSNKFSTKIILQRGWVQHLWPTGVAFAMQYMRGALWDIIDKAIKVMLMTGDHDTAPLWCALIK